MNYYTYSFFYSYLTGTVGLAFSALGILASGVFLSKFKPRARYMAAWNVFVSILTVVGVFSYTQLGCTENDKAIVQNYALG